jgi:hypothetical protein
LIDWISPEFRPFLGVGALALLFLMVASLVARYRAWQATKLRRCQALLGNAELLNPGRGKGGGPGLPREAREFQRAELGACYREALAMFPGLDNVRERLLALERSANEGGGDWNPPTFRDERALGLYSAAVTGIVDYISRERPRSAIGTEAARELQERLRVLRAQAQAGFYEESAKQAALAGRWDRAVNDVLKLLAFLKSKAPRNEYGLGLYQQALAQYRDLSNRHLPQHWVPQETNPQEGPRQAGAA